MKPTEWDLVKSIVDKALTLSGREKVTYLSTVCRKNPEICAEVEELLRSIGAAEGEQFMGPLRHDRNALLSDLSDELEQLARGKEYIGKKVGPYRITKQLGSGGMGIVFKAERIDGEFRHKVAVKLIRRGVDSEENIRRFRMEREILAGLQHPNIAQLHDGGVTDEGIPYLVMEYVDGVPIDRYCNEHRLTVNRRLGLFKEVCNAVQFAHVNLVVHRDLKAQNIYVTSGGTVKILDFGIAKLLDTRNTEVTLLETRPGQKFWTPQYAAPEQVRGETVTTATDIYALGVLLHKLLTGLYPLDLEGKSMAEAEKIIKNSLPSPPGNTFSRHPSRQKYARLRKTTAAELTRKLKGDLDALVMKCIRKEPEYRYASVSQLLEDIDRYRTGIPLSARKGTLQYRVAKFIRRHKTGLAAAVTLLIFSIGFAGFYTWKITQERNIAQLERDKAKQVSDFLAGLFEAGDPAEALGDTITMHEILETGTQRLATWDEEPLVKAQMMDVIGRVYLRLGKYDDAQPLLEEALHIRRDLLGKNNLDAAATLDNLATLFQEKGDYDKAEKQFKQVLNVRTHALGKNHTDVASSLNNLALLLEDKGEYEVADSLYKRAIAIHQKTSGPASVNLASSLGNLASLLKRKGEYVESEKLYRQVLSIRRSLLENYHPDIALTLNNLGDLLRILEQYDEAETVLREALKIRKKVYGENHPYIASTMNNLALTLKKKGEYDEAEKLYQNVLELDKELLGEKHPYVAIGLNNLGVLLMTQEKYDKAEPMLREALSIRRTLWDKGHPDLALSLNNLATLLTRTGRFEEAEKGYREAITINENLLGLQHYRTQASLRSLAHLLYETNRFEAAEHILKESHTFLKSEYGLKNKNIRATLEKLILLYEKWDKPEMAVPYKKELALSAEDE